MDETPNAPSSESTSPPPSGESESAPRPTAPTSQEADWRSALPEDLRGSNIVAEAADLPSLVRRAAEQNAYLGRSITMPGEDATPEQRAVFRQKLRKAAPELMEADLTQPEVRADILARLGRPDAPDGYKVPELTAPEGVQVDMSPVEAFRELAHEHGLTQAQYEGIVSAVSQQRMEAAKAHQDKLAEGRRQLAQEWGYAHDQKREQALAHARQSGAPDYLIQALVDDNVDADTLRWLASEFNAGREGTQASDVHESGEGQNFMTPKEARAQIDAMLSNPEHPYRNIAHPDHDEAVAEYLRLVNVAEGPAGKENQSPFVFDADTEEVAFEGIVR